MRRPSPFDPLRLGLLLACLAGAALDARGGDVPPLPLRLSDTGLFDAGAGPRVAPGLLTWSPVYPLWSDGTNKQRWMSLPAGQPVDASDPNAWVFPPGTRLWKTFGYAQPVETRLIERLADGSWRFSSYAWDADGRDARLVPAEGLSVPVAEAPGGRHEIPSREDCLACHGGTRTPVLGVSALQLSPARDPQAPHAGDGGEDLRTLVAKGHLAHLPAAMLAEPPRIPAASADERAALGYLHGNCGHCHNRSGLGVPVALDLSLQWRDGQLDADTVRRSMIGRRARYAPAGEATARVVAPGQPAHSLLSQRMQSRDPRRQMPPLGTARVDAEGLARVDAWISSLPTDKDSHP